MFVAKFDISQSGINSLVYSIRIGSGGFQGGRAVAADNSGHAYVTGGYQNFGSSLLYPTTPGAYSTVYNSGSDNMMSFVTKLTSTVPVAIDYSTYIGPGNASGIDVDPLTGEAYIAGSTRTFSFPVTAGALQTVHGQDALGNGNTDAVAVKLNATGTTLLYATFLGGDKEDNGTGIAVNSNGEAYVVGTAAELFPVSSGAYQQNFGGALDFFAVHLNSSGTGYGCGGATYIGGDDEDYGGLMYDYQAPEISIRDHQGINDTVSISGTSHSQDFPTTPGAYGPVKLNSIADQPVFFKLTCSAVTASPVIHIASSLTVNCSEATIDFTDSSSNNPTSWTWYFPGSVQGTSAQQHPLNIIYDSTGTYTVSLVACNSAGCDSGSVVINVIIPPAPSVNLGNDTVVCQLNTITLNADTGFTTYEWQLNSTILSSNLDTLHATQPGIYSVIVTNAAGCSAADTINIAAGNPDVTLGNDTVLCNTDTVQLTATAGYDQYQWYQNNSLVQTGANTYSAIQAGTYIVIATDSAGCFDSDTVNATQNIISVSLIGDTSFCSGNSVLINPGGSFFFYQWTLNGNPLSNTDSINATVSGNYILTVTDSDGCHANDSVQVTVFDLPLVQTISDSLTCTGIPIKLTTTGAVDYNWAPSTYLSAADVAEPVCTPQSLITYTVTGTDTNGCTGTDQVTIDVIAAPVADFELQQDISCNGLRVTTNNMSNGADAYLWLFGDGSTSAETEPVHTYSGFQNLPLQLIAYNAGCSDTLTVSNSSIDFNVLDTIPDVITPNGDLINDCLAIDNGLMLSGCIHLIIYNRWGSKVFETDHYECWNGESDGKAVPDGVYFYVASVNDIKKHGTVHVFR